MKDERRTHTLPLDGDLLGGRFRLLGQGGMTTVYEARHKLLDQDVVELMAWHQLGERVTTRQVGAIVTFLHALESTPDPVLIAAQPLPGLPSRPRVPNPVVHCGDDGEVTVAARTDGAPVGALVLRVRG